MMEPVPRTITSFYQQAPGTSQDDAYPSYISPKYVPRTQIFFPRCDLLPPTVPLPAQPSSSTPTPHRARHQPARTSLSSPCQIHWVANSVAQTTLAAVADPPLRWHSSPYFSFCRKQLASPLPSKAEALCLPSEPKPCSCPRSPAWARLPRPHKSPEGVSPAGSLERAAPLFR